MGLSSVSLNMAVIDIKDESSIRDGLVSLAASDCDFNGENGLDYVSDAAREAGYESDAEYYAGLVMKEFSQIENRINKFLEYWMGHDTYYDDYTVEYERVTKNKMVICVASSHS